MSNKRYFLFDCETGGLDEHNTSLLTLYGDVLDQNLDILASIDLKLKPDDGRYHVDIAAMNVNKIDLIKHSETAIPCSVGAKQLREFFTKHSSMGANKLIPAGHNINLDVRFTTKLVSDFKQYCMHRWLDTSSIGHFLQQVGVLPDTLDGGLVALATYYGIDCTGLHDAKNDVNITRQVLKAMSKQNKEAFARLVI